jgi:cell division protein FtsI (penicillin-binding protein 3)
MSFGYNLMVTPMHTAMLYNAVANKGKMMKPYLVKAVKENGKLIREMEPTVVNEKICSDETLKQLNACLGGVTSMPGATGYSLFRNTAYTVAAKTGTALVANGTRGYADKIYQSSFAGFFPVENPQFTIVVVIKNKPHAEKFYGASVAGPVFKEISDRLYTLFVKQNDQLYTATASRDSSSTHYAGYSADVKQVLDKINWKYAAPSKEADFVSVVTQDKKAAVYNLNIKGNVMPVLRGMTLKDALAACEQIGLKLAVNGKGKVFTQSVQPGIAIAKGQLINIELK